jgi:hypothetical protein
MLSTALALGLSGIAMAAPPYEARDHRTQPQPTQPHAGLGDGKGAQGAPGRDAHDDRDTRGAPNRDAHDGKGYDHDRAYDDHRNDGYEHSNVVVTPSLVIRGPYATFFLGGDSGYHQGGRAQFNGMRVLRSDMAPRSSAYWYQKRRIEPEDCRRVYYAKVKNHREAVYSEIVCRDSYGDTRAVPGTRTFERWERRR